MLGTLINVGAIFVGGVLGLLFRKKTPAAIGDRIMQGFGIFTMVIGISGAIVGKNHLLYLFSIILGAIIGESLKLDKKLEKFTHFLEYKLTKGDPTNEDFKEGLITTTMIFCVGAMSIIGPIKAVFENDLSLLMIKSSLDGVTAFIFASAFGFSVLLSGISVLVYQGLVTLGAFLLVDILSPETISAISVMGSILIIGLGINLLKIKKLNLVNLLPAMFIPILYEPIQSLIGALKNYF